MRTGRRPTLAVTLACAFVGSGCAETRSALGRRTAVGTLKASVSQLEFEKQQLQREVANLKLQNRRIEQQLAQEESAKDELITRLDDARVLLKSRGYDPDGLPGSLSSGTESDPFDRPTTTPAGQSPRARRKPPFARIPGHIEAAPPRDGAGSDQETDEEDDALDLPPSRRRDDDGPQGRLDPGPSHWQRVARRSPPRSAGPR